MKRLIAAILIIVVTAVAVYFGFLTTRGEKRKMAGTVIEDAVQVTVATVATRTFLEEREAVVSLKAQESILLNPEVSGNIQDILVDFGDRVSREDIVVRLDRVNYDLAVQQAKAALSSAEASVAFAKAQFEQAEKEYRRASDLLAEKVYPQSRFDGAEAAYKTTQEAISSAIAQRKQAEETLKISREKLKDTDIRTPMSGVVVERNVERGQAVEPGTQLLRIVDQAFIKADIELPEKDFSRIRAGQKAVVTVDALTGEEFAGTVTVINQMVNPATRTFRARIKISNQKGKLVDGMFARVKIQAGQRNSLAVPRQALTRLPGSGTYFVFVIQDNKASKRTVAVGAMEDEYAEVVSGLTEGDMIVTSASGRLRAGMKVIVQQTTENGAKPGS
jgi:RND family efflux transporter MFP subunit